MMMAIITLTAMTYSLPPTNAKYDTVRTYQLDSDGDGYCQPSCSTSAFEQPAIYGEVVYVKYLKEWMLFSNEMAR
jgi:hypothetical protein